MTSSAANAPANPSLSVVVVGAGLAGATCARTLVDGGARVRLVERGRAPGGRMASPEVHGRRVDLGPGFVTGKDDEFGALLRDWERRGLATPWVDGTEVLGPDGLTRKDGPVRWAAPGGLRTLVRDVLGDLPVELSTEVTDLETVRGDADVVVLAMPDPQAARLAPELLAQVGVVENDPTIVVAAAWPTRTWDVRCAFVNNDPDLSFVADDGSRRGDDAPVLVAHSTPELAARVLEESGRDGGGGDPQGAVRPMVDAVRRLLDLDEPEWTHAMRWGMAKPHGTHETTHHLAHGPLGRIGLVGDQWAGGGTPRVESAWRSGTDLARALLAG